MFDNICELVLGFDPCCIGIDGNISSNLYGNALEDLEEGAIYRHVLPITVWRLQNKLNIGMERKMNRGAKIMDRLLYGNIKMKKEALLANNDVATTNKAAQKLDLLTQILVGKDDEDQNANVNCMSKCELNKLVYLHGAVSETFRLYPPISFEHKCTIERDVLPSGHVVERGTKILLSIYSMGRMEEIWGKDCMEFKPERWISERGGIIHVPSYKFMPFLAGARTCLGKNMAFMQVKALASALVYNYKFQLLDAAHVIRPATSMVMVMKDGLMTRVSKRNHN
ncbi:Alkane hydroxylase MAH1 [Linum perenne]